MTVIKSFSSYLTLILLVVIFIAFSESALDRSVFSLKQRSGLDKISLYKGSFLSADLEKDGRGNWLLNGSSKADQKMVSLLSDVLNSIEVVGKVKKSEKVKVIKELKEKGIIIELYQKGFLDKAIFVSSISGAVNYSYALIEGENTPFIIRIPEAKHNLEDLLALESHAWKERKLFYDEWQTFHSLAIDYIDSPKDSFELTKQNENYLIDGKVYAKGDGFDKILNGYKNIEASGAITRNEILIDSLQLSSPFCRISIRNSDIDWSKQLNLFLPVGESSFAYGQFEVGGEVFIIPLENIKPLLVTKEFLLKANS